MSAGTDYVVDDEGLSDDRAKAVVRAALAALACDAAEVETDLPGHDAGAWPAPVEAAAEALRRPKPRAPRIWWVPRRRRPQA
ncbi:hypothetical protein [Kineococcus xinjiangensis]|uniref:hypothetical protein n=1 Tax=Kineococcus xinjiangensis TaxID=512762 RepID=UPI000CEC8AFB|nr:hypothetical protein [Kineococcus xinjiangensis]